MAKVEHKDREWETNKYHLAFRLVGINVDFELSDLIVRTVKRVDDIGGSFSIADGADINLAHEEKWLAYHRKKVKDDFSKDQA